MNAGTLNDRVQESLLASEINPNDPENASEIIATCRRVAEECGFRRVTWPKPGTEGTTDSDQVEQYASRDNPGHSVSLWVADVQGVGFADGGLGFED